MYKKIIFLSAFLIVSSLQSYGRSLEQTHTGVGNKDKNVDSEISVIDDSWLSCSNIAYAELALIIILLAYIIIKGFSRAKRNRKISDDLKRIRQERDELRYKNESISRDLKEINALREEDRSQLALLQEEKFIALPNQPIEAEATINTMEWDKPEAPKKIQEIFYSRYADLADGFSAAELLTKESNDTIFEITILSPNKASFKVSINPAAQKYALSNADYFLQPTCRYDALPSGIIINEIPGSLSLIGGKWEIKEKARISFK